MKPKIFIFLLLFLGCSIKLNAQDTLLNTQIVKLVKGSIGKKIDRGECWDLAAMVLNKTNAKWNGLYEYGEKLNIKTDKIYPGDIIQFEKVKLRYQIGKNIFEESMYHHTAIVYDVIDDHTFKIAHQNNAEFGKKVGISLLNLDYVTKGEIIFYRPVKN